MTKEENMEMHESLGLLAPWELYALEVRALFGDDPDVGVGAPEREDGGYALTLRVDGGDKADAIRALLPESVAFGTVTLGVQVVPSNAEPGMDGLLRRAFAGNPHVSRIEFVDGEWSPRANTTFVLFEPEVVQYRADDLGDYNGIRTTLLQDIAPKLLDTGDAKVQFCTEVAV